MTADRKTSRAIKTKSPQKIRVAGFRSQSTKTGTVQNKKAASGLNPARDRKPSDRDVHQKQAEEALEQHKSRPGQLIAEHTSDLGKSNKRLRSQFAKRKRAEAALLQSGKNLSIWTRIQDIFLTAPDVDMYGEVLQVILDATGSELGVFGYLDEDGALVVPSMSRHIWDRCQALDKTNRFPRETWGDGIWPRAIRQKRTFFSNEPSRLVLEGHMAIRRNISTPILHRNKVIGLFQVANKSTDYKTIDIEFLETLAKRIAPVLQARLQHDREEKRRQLAEDALRSSETKYRTLVENLPQKIFFKDKHCRWVTGNANFLKDFGLTEKQIAGMTDYDFFPKELADKYHADDLRILSSGSTEEQDEEYIQHGERRIVHSVKTAVRDDKGEIQGVSGIFWDVTKKILAEKEIVRLNEDLSRQVQKMAALNKELERSNKDLEQFAYVASHDLQEPLRMVSSFTQLLETRYKGKLDQNADDFIGYAVEGAKHMQMMINDLLSYSRINTRGAVFSPVEIESVLGQVQVNLLPAIQEKQALITHDPLPIVTADASQMIQLFQNLISNAIKFRGSSRPRIHIFCKTKGPDWQFGVRDNGIGIEQDYSDRIFIIFQRLHEKEKYPGTGIGLAICKKIVERHGGRIWVESEPDRGSTFYFTIPKERRDA